MNICIIGAGKSGLAAARLALAKGHSVSLSDQSSSCELPHDLQSIALELGGHSQNFILKHDVIILSPGVDCKSEVVGWAKAADIPVISELEFACSFVAAPIIAITGSNGKTTTSTLIAQMLEAAGYRTYLCGNIGTPLSDFVLKDEPDYYVMEASSFQLECIDQFHPHIAIFLNFSQNHLDRHKDLEEYFQAKCQLFKNQIATDYAVLNQRDQAHHNLAERLSAQVVWFNDQDSAYNANQQAVIKVAEILNISQDLVQDVLAHFSGVEHRLEQVLNKDDIVWINDSKCTTVEAGRFALEHIDRPLIWLVGGRDKNSDFSVLKSALPNRIKHMIAFGEARAKIMNTFKDSVSISDAVNLKEAIEQAQSQVQAGDCVLLSPMCTSFDEFNNYEERGQFFKKTVLQK